ncbi:MAG: GSCFA domain-containing protein [Flavobacteriaceae bacterium]|nr:GSCFA domain-containing protein [Flavobacteriaceae bacterium]
MKFRTKIKIPKEKKAIDYNSKIVLFGSCFTENIETHFNHFKFQNTSNSHGILFNPKSIETAIDDCVNKKEYNQHDLSYFDDVWLSFNHHTKFSSAYLAEILYQINKEITNTHEVLINASHVLITLGTSWVYRYNETENLVANCHKVSQRNFKKELLSIDENIEIIRQMTSLIHRINNKATVIFTVSPVRHLKDGFIENTQSKASLLTAIHQVIDNKTAFYFPSYEIMMDDLRDYRFYKKDLLHPNEIAMDYIWGIFKQAWISEKSHPMMKEIDNIQKSLNHKPFREDSEKHQQFLKNLEDKIEIVTKKFPQMNFKKKTV